MSNVFSRISSLPGGLSDFFSVSESSPINSTVTNELYIIEPYTFFFIENFIFLLVGLLIEISSFPSQPGSNVVATCPKPSDTIFTLEKKLPARVDEIAIDSHVFINTVSFLSIITYVSSSFSITFNKHLRFVEYTKHVGVKL